MFNIDCPASALFLLHPFGDNKRAAKEHKVLLGDSGDMCDGSLRSLFDNSPSGSGVINKLLIYSLISI